MHDSSPTVFPFFPSRRVQKEDCPRDSGMREPAKCILPLTPKHAYTQTPRNLRIPRGLAAFFLSLSLSFACAPHARKRNLASLCMRRPNAPAPRRGSFFSLLFLALVRRLSRVEGAYGWPIASWDCFFRFSSRGRDFPWKIPSVLGVRAEMAVTHFVSVRNHELRGLFGIFKWLELRNGLFVGLSKKDGEIFRDGNDIVLLIYRFQS